MDIKVFYWLSDNYFKMRPTRFIIDEEWIKDKIIQELKADGVENFEVDGVEIESIET